MFLNSRRGTPTARAIDGFDWDVAALPTAVEPAGILHSDAYCMAAATEDKDAAWTFIEFANSPAGPGHRGRVRADGALAHRGGLVGGLPGPVGGQPANSEVWLETVDTLRDGAGDGGLGGHRGAHR